MKIRLQDGLPHVSATLHHHDQQLVLANVVLDTGSVGTLFSIDKLSGLGVIYEAGDIIHRIRGIGGAELVIVKQLDLVAVDDLKVRDLEVELGAVAYGFEIDGIIGMDFLTATGSVIDLTRLEIYQASS